MSENNPNPPAEPAKVSPDPVAQPVAPVIPSPQPAALVTATELTADLVTAMPEVTDKKDSAAPNSPPVETPANIAELIDNNGVKFDPAIHAANSDGSPKLNFKKNFYSKNVGRAKGSKKDDAESGETLPPENTEIKFAGIEPPPAMPGAPDQATGAAMMLVPTIDGIMQSVFTDGVALTEQDKAIATPVLAAYMRSKDMKDIPPGIALAMIAVAIYGPKFSKPTVRERITLIVLKIRNFFKKDDPK